MEDFKRTIITTDTELENICNRLIEKEQLASVDSETTGLDARRSKLRLVQISGRSLQETFIIDYFKITNPEPLRRFMLHYSPKLNYNGQFDNCFFLHNFDAYIEFPVDLFLGAQLLQRYGLPPNVKSSDHKAWQQQLVPYLKDIQVERRRGKGVLTLKSVMKLFTGIEISKEMQVSDWSGELSDQQLDYAAKDTELLFPLFDVMMDEIMSEDLVDAFATENGCQLATSMMHYYGINLDMNQTKLLSEEISTKIKTIESRVSEYPEFHSDSPSLIDLMNGVTTSINIGSHDQVIVALTKRWGNDWWKTVEMEKPSTQAADLKKFHDRDPELVTMLSQRASLQSIYSKVDVEGLSSYIDPLTGRIHSNFMQNSSPQNRISSEKPILLNIPNTVKYGPRVMDKNSAMYSDRSFRDLFVAEEGCLFVKSDYSSLQLMALAQESNDSTLIDIFNNGKSIHKVTASVIFDKPESEIDKSSSIYYTSKTVNYAVGFVCGPQRLQNTFAEDDVHYSLKECKSFIDKYMQTYPGVKRYHNAQSERARRNGKVSINGGRATLLHGDVGDRPSDLTNFPMALYEVSGGKYAAMRIARICFLLKEHGVKIARLVLMVHDEIMIEIDESYAKAMAEVLEREMIKSMTRYIHKVPIGVETTICKTWGGKAIEPRESKPLPFKVKEIAA